MSHRFSNLFTGWKLTNALITSCFLLQTRLSLQLNQLNLSQIAEGIAKSCIIEHLIRSLQLFNPVQSACVPEISLHWNSPSFTSRSSYHSYSTSASNLSLFTRSIPAFEWFHSLWFGIHGTALNWFKSYLSDRLFCVKCSHELSEPHKSCYGVPQGSVLGPPFHTLLSSLISSLSLIHHS